MTSEATTNGQARQEESRLRSSFYRRTSDPQVARIIIETMERDPQLRTANPWLYMRARDQLAWRERRDQQMAAVGRRIGHWAGATGRRLSRACAALRRAVTALPEPAPAAAAPVEPSKSDMQLAMGLIELFTQHPDLCATRPQLLKRALEAAQRAMTRSAST